MVGGRAQTDVDNPWLRLTSVLESAKTGNFDQLGTLFDGLRDSDNSVLWRATFELMGDAGTSSFLKRVLDEFSTELWDQPDPIYQRHVAYALAQSGLLWAVPVLLEFYLGNNDRRETGIISILLSRMLEAEPGAIAIATNSDDEYRGLVEQKYRELRTLTRTDEAPVMAGQPFSVRGVVEQLYDSIRAQSPPAPLIRHYRHLFEAATGSNCSAFFAAGELQSRKALAIIEEFLINGGLTPYEDGIRYFYSHPIETSSSQP